MIIFYCKGCGHPNYIDAEPDKVKGKIFKCEKCGEKTLLKNQIDGPPTEKISTLPIDHR